MSSFFRLVYRDFYMSKKALLISAFSFIAFFVLSILVVISFDYGNIRTILLETVLKDLPEAEEMLGTYKENFGFVLKIYPIFCAVSMSIEAAQVSINDEKTAWKYFYRSAPVSCRKKALVKFFEFFVLDILGFIVSYGYSLVFSAVSGIEMSRSDMGMILAGIALGTAIAVLLYIFILIFHSLDKAGLMLVATFTAVIVGIETYFAFHPQKDVSDMGAFAELKNAFETLAPYSVLITAAFLLVGFFITEMLYKRREK